jgi:hypothetical protein
VIFNIKRLTKLAGEDFSSSKCRVRNPHITARDSIEIGSYIVAQEKHIVELEETQNQLLSLIYNTAIGNVTMGYPVNIESLASEAYEITGINAEQTIGGAE